MKNIFLGLVFSVVYIKEIAYDLECVKGKSKWKNEAEHADVSLKNCVDIENDKICVFQNCKNCKADYYP